MTSEVNQKVQLLVHHFITRNDGIFLDNDKNILMAELFTKIILDDSLFDEKHIFTEVNANQHQFNIENCIEKIRSAEKGAESELIDAIANAEAYKYRLEIPYEDITRLIYDFNGDISLLTLAEKFDGFEFALKDTKFQNDVFEKRKVEKAYKKFKRHLKLAVAQKIYFLSINKQAEDQANNAKLISSQAEKAAQEAQTLSSAAKEIAGRAQEIFDSSLVNYITILGIFASIIITVFGGINLTNATVKLLESEHDLPMMVFVVSFLMLGFISILIVLITWISSLRKQTEYSSAVKWWILSGFGLLALFSGIYLNQKIKVDAQCQIGYFTCLQMEDIKKPFFKTVEENKESDQ